MPTEKFEKLVDLAKLSEEISPLEILPDFWNTPNSARKGALAKIKLYGNLGTPEGRRKGGLAAIETYRNIGWTITSYADTLRAEVHETLRTLGFSPTLTAPNLSVFLRQRDDIERYFQEIGTHNNKHWNRYQGFINQKGDVV